MLALYHTAALEKGTCAIMLVTTQRTIDANVIAEELMFRVGVPGGSLQTKV